MSKKPWQWVLRDLPFIGWILWGLIVLLRLTPHPWSPPDKDPEEIEYDDAA